MLFYFCHLKKLVRPETFGPHYVCYCNMLTCGPGELCRYSNSLRAGRSGDRIPVEARFSAPVQTGPGAHPAFYTTGTGSFPGVKRPGLGVYHPPHLVSRLKEGTAITLLPLWAFVFCSRVTFTFSTLT